MGLRHTSATGLAVLALTLALPLFACSSSSGGEGPGKTRPMDGAAASDAPGLDAQAEAQADGGAACNQCPGTPPAESICAVSADAQLVDTTGAPAEGHVLLLCGLNLCSLPVKTDAQGKAHFDLCLNMKSPALKFLGGPGYVSFGVAMTRPTESFPPVTVIPLPAQGTALPAGAGSVSSGPVTLKVAAGSVTFDPTQAMDANSIEFRAAAVTPTQAPPGLDPALGVKALWGLAPQNATLNPPGTLTIPNPDPAAWPAGTQVDFIENGLDESPTPPAPYGGWGRVSTGTVSADGKTITTTGLPILGLVGVGPHM